MGRPPTTVQAADRDLSWMQRARCVDAPPGAMFPASNEGQAELIAKWCDRCAVKERCAEYALVNRIPHGIWGGMTEAGRRRVLKARAKAAADG